MTTEPASLTTTTSTPVPFSPEWYAAAARPDQRWAAPGRVERVAEAVFNAVMLTIITVTSVRVSRSTLLAVVVVVGIGGGLAVAADYACAVWPSLAG